MAKLSGVRKKVFAYYLDDHHGGGMPAYIGPRGWVGLRLDVGSIDWQEVTELVTDSYRLAAPKRLAALAGRTSSLSG